MRSTPCSVRTFWVAATFCNRARLATGSSAATINPATRLAYGIRCLLWTPALAATSSLYSADKRINDLKQTNQLTDEKVDNWIQDVTVKFKRLVYDEIWLLLQHRREIALHMKTVIDDRPVAAFNQREQVFERLKFTVIDHDKLTTNQKEIYSLVWHDLVEFVNQSLVIPPFRREPP